VWITNSKIGMMKNTNKIYNRMVLVINRITTKAIKSTTVVHWCFTVI